MSDREVSFTLGPNDYDRMFEKRLGRTGFAGTASMTGTMIGSTIVSLLGVGVTVYFAMQIGGALWFPTIAIIVVLSMALIVPAVAMMSARKRLRTKSKTRALVDLSIRLTEDGLQTTSKDSTMSASWNSITDIQDDQWGLYFEPVTVGRFVPRHAFPTAADFDTFAVAARRLHAENRHRIPEVAPSIGPVARVRYTPETADLQAIAASRPGGKAVAARMAGINRIGNVTTVIFVLLIGFISVFLIMPDIRRMFHNTGWVSPQSIGFGAAAVVYAIYRILSTKHSNPIQSKAFDSIRPMLTMELRLDDRGTTLVTQSTEATTPWTRFAGVDVDDRLLRFKTVDGTPIQNVPRSAFTSEDELMYFVDVARAYVDQARTGELASFPEPVSWPPPPSG